MFSKNEILKIIEEIGGEVTPSCISLTHEELMTFYEKLYDYAHDKGFQTALYRTTLINHYD